MEWSKKSCREACDGEVSERSLLEWIASLPWVIELTPSFGPDGLRTFAVDCEVLGVRQMLLVTGFSHRRGVAVIVPDSLADDLELVGFARSVAPMPPGHVLVEVAGNVGRDDLERMILEAYGSAMS